MNNLPRWAQIGGSIALCILLFLFGFFGLMPRKSLGRIVDAQLEKATSFRYDVHVDSAALTGLSSASVQSIQLQSRASAIDGISPGVATIDRARVGAGLFSLLRQKPSIRSRIDFPSGTMRVYATVDKKSLSNLEIQFHDVDLADIGILRDTLKMPLLGTVRGTITGTTNDEGVIATGNVDLNILGARVGPRRITAADLPEDVRRIFAGEIVIPAVNAGDLLLRGNIEDGVLTITEFEGQGPDLRLGGDGQIHLRSPITTSDLQLALNVAIDARWVEEAQIGGILSSVPMIANAQQDDKLVFNLGGTLGRPRVISGTGSRRRTGR